MIHELYKETIREIALNVTQTSIDSVRKKNITKSGCRVYGNGYLGIAGTLGEATEDTWREAEKNLIRKISYSYEPEKNKERTRDLRNAELTEDRFMEQSEKLLSEMRTEFPKFIFSNKIKLVEKEINLSNDAGLKFKNIDRYVDVELIIKHIDSVNVFDSAVVYRGRSFDINQILSETREQYEAYSYETELPERKKVPVIAQFMELSSKLNESLNGETLGRNVSIFRDKIKTKVFHEDFTLYQDRSDENIGTAFFDLEGSVLSEDRKELIENGIIQVGYTDKKNAEEFEMPNTAAAEGYYDDVPTLGEGQLSVKPSKKTLQELLDGKDAIFIVLMSGGDCTNEGDFASPVQIAYLMKDGKLAGKLPQFAVAGNIYDMFGKDYIGVSADKPCFGNHVIVMNMKII